MNPRAEGVVRIVAIGDTGKGNAGQRRVAEAIGAVCAARGCDLGVLLGDNLYPRGMQSADDPRMDEVFTEIYGGLDLPFYGVLGNHDWGHGRDEQAAAWQVAWAGRSEQLEMPGRFYAFSAGEVDLFALDTTPIFFRNGADQAAWLAGALAASEARWKVVIGHHTFRSDGKHGNAGDYEGLGWVPVLDGAPLQALFEGTVCGGADLYLSGHDHLLQWIPYCGMDLVVSGAGASATEEIARGNVARFSAATLGFAWVELGEDLTVAFYDADGTLLYEGSRPGPAGAR